MKRIDWCYEVHGGGAASCAVQVLRHVFGFSYPNANGIAHQFGRKQNRGMNMRQWLPMYLTVAKKKKRTLIELDASEISSFGKTVKTFSRKCGRGTYIVWVSGHILAIKDGEVLDWSDGRQLRIKRVWMVI